MAKSKKILSLLLAVVMTAAMLPMAAMAADNANVGVRVITKEIDGTTQTVALQAMLPENSEGITSIATMLSFNTAKLTLQDDAGEAVTVAATPSDVRSSVDVILTDAANADYTIYDADVALSNGGYAILSITLSEDGDSTPNTSQDKAGWQDVYLLKFTTNGEATTTDIRFVDNTTTDATGLAALDAANYNAASFVMVGSDTLAVNSFVYGNHGVSNTFDSFDTMTAEGTGTFDPEEPPYIRGDADLNGRVELADVILILDYLASKISLNDTQLAAANVDEASPGVALNDVIKILDYLASKITEL